MTEDQAYVLGLFVGGGTISSSSFIITLPLKSWGLQPRNIHSLSRDFAIEIKKRFQRAYNIIVDYNATNDSWTLFPDAASGQACDLSQLISDLSLYGLPTSGELLKSANLAQLKSSISQYHAEYFISGLIDTRGSVEGSHRRFNNNAPIVSFEVPGSTMNFVFVMQFCSWLHELGTFADQILYNHPSQHAAANPFYRNWKKGFKIRFLAKDFLQTKSFSLQAKAGDAGRAAQRQTVQDQGPCEHRCLSGRVKPICIHSEINSSSLPPEVRSRVFLHYFHYCAILGCPYAPVSELQQIVRDYKKRISVLPLLQKFGVEYSVAGRSRIVRTPQPVAVPAAESKYNALKQAYFPASLTMRRNCSVDEVIHDDDYRIYKKLEEAVAFLLSPRLNGQRHVGNMDAIIDCERSTQLVVLKTDKIGEPILLMNPARDRAAIISSIESQFNRDLLDQLLSINGLELNVNPGFSL